MRRLVAFAATVLVACSDSSSPAPEDQADAAAPPPPCTPQAADEAFAQSHAPTSNDVVLAKAIADRWMEEHPADSLVWDWTDAVLAAGFVDLYRVTNDARYRDYLARYIDHHIAAGYYVSTSDSCPPAISANLLYRATCRAEYRTVNETVLRYLYDEAVRTEDGGINHLGVSTIFPPTLWVDSLFMFGEVLVRWGESEPDTRALDEYGKQLSIFAAHLQDPSGFFKHAFQWTAPQDPGVFWGRGNGWVLASAYDYLRARAARGERDDAAAASLAKLAAAVVAAQDPATGLYWTVVNKPGETYLETSATALFATGLARGRRAGLLDASVVPVVKRALDGVKGKLTVDSRGRPIVSGTSGPTGAGDFKNYASVAVKDDLSYGVGAVLLALVEGSGLE